MRILLFTFLLLSSAARAGDWTFEDFKQEAASPVTTKARYVLITGALATGALLLSEDQVGDPFDNKQVRNRTLGDSSRYGDWMGQLIPNALYVGGMAIASRYGDTKAHDRAIGMFKATAYAAGTTTLLKYTIREPRPDDHTQRDSFPSGHTTTAFAFSGYVVEEHGWGWGSAALLLSSFTAYSRINDGRHRLQDVVAGATIGWSYGWGIAHLQREKKESSAYVVPLFDRETAGVALYGEFQ